MCRRDTNGETIGTDREKIFVKNDGTSSKLVIKDVQVSDSGVYQLFAYNGALTNNISVTLLVEGNKNNTNTILYRFMHEQL